jgi:hypothetical protein
MAEPEKQLNSELESSDQEAHIETIKVVTKVEEPDGKASELSSHRSLDTSVEVTGLTETDKVLEPASFPKTSKAVCKFYSI